MPRVSTQKKERSPAQLANDERLRNARKSVAPVVIRKMTETAEQSVGQDGVREFDKNNELTKVIQIPQGKKSAKWMEDMQFANEIVTVRINPSTDKLAHPFPEVTVNGRVQRFVRGAEQKVRRCYVEKLARLKLTTYANLKTKDVDGEDVYRYPSTTGLVYDFTVIGDSQKGTEWLKGVLAEP